MHKIKPLGSKTLSLVNLLKMKIFVLLLQRLYNRDLKNMCLCGWIQFKGTYNNWIIFCILSRCWAGGRRQPRKFYMIININQLTQQKVDGLNIIRTNYLYITSHYDLLEILFRMRSMGVLDKREQKMATLCWDKCQTNASINPSKISRGELDELILIWQLFSSWAILVAPLEGVPPLTLLAVKKSPSIWDIYQ